MSYIMTISGTLPANAFPPIEFLPISKGQKYVADLESELSQSDGTPLWFVHDGRTGTSHDFIRDARNHYSEHGSFDGTLLMRLMEACIDADCVFRIWWASGKPDCYRNLTEFTGVRDLCSALSKMLSEGGDICVRRKRGGQPGAPPNGGPATPFGNSGATEGPPSVS